MRRSNPTIQQRRRYFIGCEGESEQSYVKCLGTIANNLKLPIHLDAVLLQPGGGDPLAIIEIAAKKATQRADNKSRYDGLYVFLDDDKKGLTPQRDAKIPSVAKKASLTLIWQHTCHEALLLRHLDGCSHKRPSNTGLALSTLKTEWPSYEKGMTALQLGGRLDAAAFRRAAGVEPVLAVLLGAVGFEL